MRPEDLEEIHNNKLKQSDKESDSVEEADTPDEQDYYDKLRSASDVLKRSGILFEFLASPELVARLTKRERDIMLKHAANIDILVDELDELLEDMED